MKRKERIQQEKALKAVEALEWPDNTLWAIKRLEGKDCIRGLPGRDAAGWMCPLEAMSVKKTRHINVWGWRAVAHNLGMETASAAEVVLAADEHKDHNPAVRAALMAKVGLR